MSENVDQILAQMESRRATLMRFRLAPLAEQRKAVLIASNDDPADEVEKSPGHDEYISHRTRPWFRWKNGE